MDWPENTSMIGNNRRLEGTKRKSCGYSPGRGNSKGESSMQEGPWGIWKQQEDHSG